MFHYLWESKNTRQQWPQNYTILSNVSLFHHKTTYTTYTIQYFITCGRVKSQDNDQNNYTTLSNVSFRAGRGRSQLIKTVTITETTTYANIGGPKRNRSEVRPSIATRQPVDKFCFCHNRPGATRTSLQTCSDENVNNMRQERSESARGRRIISNLLFYAISHYGLYQGESGD